MTSMSVRPSDSSPDSSCFTSVSSCAYCVKRPSNQAFFYSENPSLLFESDSSSSSPPSPPSLFSGVVASVLPLSLISLLLDSSNPSRARFSVSSLYHLSSSIPPLTRSSRSLTACISTYIPDSRPAQRFTLPHDSLACSPTARRISLAMRRRHTYTMPNGLTTIHLSRVTIPATMMSR